MTKFGKKIMAMGAAVMMAVSMMSMSANASTEEKVFAFELERGENSYTSPAYKNNYTSYSSITPTSGYLSTTYFLYATAYKYSPSTSISNSYKLTSLNHQTKIFYNTVTPSYGTRLKIKGNAGYYGASVSGGWTP